MAIASSGLGLSRLIGGILSRLLGGSKKIRVSPVAREREEFEEGVKDQFKKLKEKGLSIPVFTL